MIQRNTTLCHIDKQSAPCTRAKHTHRAPAIFRVSTLITRKHQRALNPATDIIIPVVWTRSRTVNINWTQRNMFRGRQLHHRPGEMQIIAFEISTDIKLQKKGDTRASPPPPFYSRIFLVLYSWSLYWWNVHKLVKKNVNPKFTFFYFISFLYVTRNKCIG